MQHGPRSQVSVDLGLDDDEKGILRDMAFKAIRSRCSGQPLPIVGSDYPKLMQKRGAFVCIHKGKELRGCIGMIEARAPLLETIRNMAVQAAFADPRFCAVQPDEFGDLDIEISVLTPLEPVRDPERIEIGKHGLYIKKGYHSGLLLPQVATEHDWNRDQFLEWTCRKAGLDEGAWKDPETEIYVFSADVF
jgi:AmmeMemoRadiSam system protein A